MTARERHTSEGPGTALADIPREQVTPFPLLSAMFVAPTADRASGCVDLCSCVPSLQQKHLVELAVQQGLLHECPLPPSCGPASAPPGRPTDALRFQLLSQLANGKLDAAVPFLPPTVACLDTDLDVTQRAAVAKALHTPDLCLIQGRAGSGKSRVAAEIVTQAAGQGLRILLLSHTAAAIDRILEMVSGREQIYALRCLAREEALESLRPISQGLTFAERSRILRQRTLDSARQTQLEIEQRLLQHPRERTLWPIFQEMCVQRLQHEQELTRLQHAHTQLAASLEQQIRSAFPGMPTPTESNGELHATAQQQSFLRDLAERRQTCQAQQVSRDTQRQQATLEREQLLTRQAEATSRLNALRPLAEAMKFGHWWAPAYWRAKLHGDVVGRQAEAQQHLETLRLELEQVERRLAVLQAETETSEKQLADELETLKQAYLAEQGQVLAQECRIVQEKVNALTQDWRRLREELPAEPMRPAELNSLAVSAALQHWEQACAREEEKARFLRQWLEYVEEFSATLASRLPRLANVVAATVRGLQDDPHFGDSQAESHFDLLVLDEAHLVTEPELLKVARRASRWILIGEPAWEAEDAARETPQDKSASGRSPSPSRHAPARTGRLPGLFRKLWSHLHCDPSQSPYDWYHAGGRLCCRLRHVPTQLSGYVETEAVADRPDVELRIVTPPRETPYLAEVLFPASLSLREAKQYIYQELQEVVIRTQVRQLLWLEDGARVRLQMARTLPAAIEEVQLAEGITEHLTADPVTTVKTVHQMARTAALEFSCDKDWTPEHARDWLAKHLRWRDLGRTALLEHSHRMHSPLGAVVNAILHGTSRRYSENGHAPEMHETEKKAAAPVEFIPVPSAHERRDRRRRDDGSSRHLAPAAGAGLELELVAGKIPDDLPDDMRGLPVPGVINYAEAQAVIRKVEELAADPVVRQAAQAQRPGTCCPVIAVMALYAAQVELIRRLLRRSSKLSHSALTIEVGLPEAFRQRECLVSLISLTRSQGGRAVSYGDNCEALPLALTRARQRILLFGDPGQLARRCQWRGALDHLDENAAGLEKRWLEQLLKNLHGQPG